VPNGSPYEAGKTDVRVQLGVKRVVESGLPFVYLNQVGGQDEVVYDGASFALGADRSLKAKLASVRGRRSRPSSSGVAPAVGSASLVRSRANSTSSNPSTRRWCSACATT